MRAVLAVLLALLFAVHTAYAAAPRVDECCGDMCVDMPCAVTSCAVCQAVAAGAEVGPLRHPDTTSAKPHGPMASPGVRIETIWRPPWAMV